MIDVLQSCLLPWQFRLCLFFFLFVGRKHTRTHAMTVHGNFACYCQPALYDTTFMRSTLMSFLAYVTFLPLHLHTALETKMNTVMNLSKSIIFSHDLNNRKTNETSSYLILKKCKSLNWKPTWPLWESPSKLFTLLEKKSSSFPCIPQTFHLFRYRELKRVLS